MKIDLVGVEPLEGAWGRDYKNIEEAQKDFDDGKEFKTAGRQYTTKHELKKYIPGMDQIRVRYNKRQTTAFLSMDEDLVAEKEKA